MITVTTIGFWGAYPEAGEATSAYLLQSQGYNVLLDCGSAALSLLPRFLDPKELDAAVLSHYHADHAADVGCLQYAARIALELGRRDRPPTLYGPEGDLCPPLAYHDFTRAAHIAAGRPVSIGPFTFTFQPTAHPVLCFAMRIEAKGKSIVYSADTGWDEALGRFAAGADLLLCESSLYNRYRGRVQGHLTAGEAGRLAAAAAAAHLVLTHLPHMGDHGELLSEARQEYSGPAELAATGKRWEL